MRRTRVIFVCSHNSARSQMAEGMLGAWGGDGFEVQSAGIEAGGLRDEAVTVMAEIGIDIRDQSSKTLDSYLGQPFDWVITVCDSARERCPAFAGAERALHWGVDDPSAVNGPDDMRLAAFRRARDDLRGRIQGFLRGDSQGDAPRSRP